MSHQIALKEGNVMSGEFPSDYHPLAPILRQLRGALAWHAATDSQLDAQEFAALFQRLNASSLKASPRLDPTTRLLKVAGHWSTLPTQTSPLVSTEISAGSEVTHSTDEIPLASTEPLPVAQFPAVTHERSVVPSASFETSPPHSEEAEGSALLMWPSPTLRAHRGVISPPAAKLEAEPSPASNPAPSTWADPPEAPTSSAPLTLSTSSQDPRAQLWANQPAAPPTPPTSPQVESDQAARLGSSLAQLTQRKHAPSTSTPVKSNSTKARAPLSEARSVQVRRRGYEADERYAQICDQVWGCQRCPRHTGQHFVGDGHYGARVMFVVAHPQEGDLQRGRLLFTPPERGLFNQILRALSLSRLEIYMTSLMKCHTTLPTESEWAQCQEHFRGELELVHPELVVSLGYIASVMLLGDGVRPGEFGHYQGVDILPTVHPSEILSGGDVVKRTAWRHLREVIRRLGTS